MDKTYAPEAWRRLGKVLEQRRGALGYGYRQRGRFLRERGGGHPPSEKMLARLERGERASYPDSTIRLLETLYDFGPGSFEAILRGEEPPSAVPLRVVPPPQPAADETALGEWLDILRRSDPGLMREAEPVIAMLLKLPHPDGGLRSFREREAMVRAVLKEMAAYGRQSGSGSGTGG
jgi:hypothetical protein